MYLLYGNVRYVGGVWRGRCGSLFSLGVCRSHCSPLLRFLKNGKWSVADSNSMAPALWVDGQWQLVTLSKSNPSSAVRFVTAESGPPPPAEPLSGTSEVHPQLEDLGPNASLTDWTRELEALRVRQVNRTTRPVVPLVKLLGLS